MKFKIIGDSLIYVDEGYTIVNGENEFDIIEIEAPRYRNGLDCMSMSFRITATSVEDTSITAVQVLAKQELDDKKILLSGSVTADFSSIEGKALFMVTGTSSSGITAIFKSSRPIAIENNTSLDSLPDRTAAEQLFNQAQLEAQKAMDAVTETREMLDNFVPDFTPYVATEVNAGVIKSGGDISVDDDGLVTVNSVNGKTVSKNVPENAVFTDTVYTLPVADENNLGGIKSGGDISVSGGGTVTVNSVNGKTLEKDVPANAVFTDTVYELPKATVQKLGGVIVDGDTIVSNTDGVISVSENMASKTDVEEASEFVINEIKAYLGYTDPDILGLQADFENSVFTRLGGCVGLATGANTPTEFFDSFSMFGGRRRCNVLDDGTITAYYGDDDYVEDGSNGQVMVYQPKFYYKVVPLKLEPITDGIGNHLRKANYYISETPKMGFKLHPAFYDESRNPVDYILLSAYEGSIYDVSANAYLANDEQVGDFTANTGDKLSSIVGVKPCSGVTQNLTRANAEQLAANRGLGWHIDTIQTLSAIQILTVIEYASFNMQSAIGNGIVNKSFIAGVNSAENTGKTTILGNNSGIGEENAVSYRGSENLWGNMYRFVSNVNVSRINDNFYIVSLPDTSVYAPFTDTIAYINAFSYCSECDWLFIGSEYAGSSSLPIGDAVIFANLRHFSGDGIYICSGSWTTNYQAGMFFIDYSPIDTRYAHTGCRLVYIPTNNIE